MYVCAVCVSSCVCVCGVVCLRLSLSSSNSPSVLFLKTIHCLPPVHQSISPSSWVAGSGMSIAFFPTLHCAVCVCVCVCECVCVCVCMFVNILTSKCCNSCLYNLVAGKQALVATAHNRWVQFLIINHFFK